jgi:hypothetical protein
MIYFWWNIWKERNRRTFQQKNPSTKTGGYALQRGHSTASVGNSQSSKLSVGLWLRLPFWLLRLSPVWCLFFLLAGALL